jgi:pimeloyl-ACP methyl ester carboxylesterase
MSAYCVYSVAQIEQQNNATDSNQMAMTGQLYVEKLSPRPASSNAPLPIIFIAGAAQTGTNFLDTPDGRPGWASYFVSKGHTVYLSDQPARGRSFWYPGQGSLGTIGSPDLVSDIFTDVSNNGDQWPQAKLHMQWPGTGRIGDPTFDTFYRSQMQFQTDRLLSEEQNAQAYTALVDLIGSCYVISHSQAGAYGIQGQTVFFAQWLTTGQAGESGICAQILFKVSCSWSRLARPSHSVRRSETMPLSLLVSPTFLLSTSLL